MAEDDCSSRESPTRDRPRSTPNYLQQLLLIPNRTRQTGRALPMVVDNSSILPGPDPGGGDADFRSRDVGNRDQGRVSADGESREILGSRENSSRQLASAPPYTPTSAFTPTPASSDQPERAVHQVQATHTVQPLRESNMDRGSFADGNESPDDLNGSYPHDDMSPEAYCSSSPGPVYMCRFCSYSTTTFTHLQIHMSKHGGHKALKCPLCDYCTNDKSNFRRHRRLHVRSNPAATLRCDKCEYSTVAARKMREHYSRAHNEDYIPALNCTLQATLYSNGGPYSGLARSGGICTTSVGGGIQLPGASSSFPQFLAPQHGTIQFGRNPTHLLNNCIGSSFANAAGSQTHHYNSGRGLIMRDENEISSNCMRSIVSDIVPPQPRIPVTSTITSSSFYLPTGNVTPPSIHHQSAQNRRQLHHHVPSGRQAPMVHYAEDVRIKQEPIDCDGVSDVSSSGAPSGKDRDRERQHRYMEPQSTLPSHHRASLGTTAARSISPLDQSDEVAPSGEMLAVSQSEAASSHVDGSAGPFGDSDRGGRNSRGSAGGGDGLHSLPLIKTESSSIGIQCSFTIKSEPSSSSASSTIERGSEWRRLSRYVVIERGVQCELISSASPRCLASRTASADSEQPSVTGSDTRCSHCGITFDDEVLFTIHIGCHSHTDPFVCNVCGKKCMNKYGFYSHIMRGHHF